MIAELQRANAEPRLAFRTAAQLPRTPTGKIHKPCLVEELAANSAT
jgi:hypothetical protein